MPELKPWEKYKEPASTGKPWEKYSAPQEPTQETAQGPSAGTSAAQTGVESFGNAAAFGYLPQMQAGAEKAMGLIGSAKDRALDAIGLDQYASTDYGLKKQGFTLPEENYVDIRDANIARQSAQGEQNPISSLAGGVGGTVASALATPLPALQGMSKIPVIGRGILGAAAKGSIYGAGQGFVQNPGDVQGEVSPVQLDDRLENAKSGAKTGALAGAGSEAAIKGLRAVKEAPGKIKKFAQTAAFKSAGGMLKDFRAAAGKGEVQKVGQFMLDKGLIKAGDTVEDVAIKAKALNAQAGEALDDVYARTQSKPKIFDAAEDAMQSEGGRVNTKQPVGFNPTADKAKILEEAKAKLGDSVDKKSALKSVSDYLDDLIEEYGDTHLDPRKANDIKTAIDQKIDYARNPLNKQPVVEKAFKAARRYISGLIDESVNAIGKESGDPALAKQLKEANSAYGMSKQIGNMAADRVSRVNANQMFGLTDRIAGSAGGAAGVLLPAMTGNSDPTTMGAMGLIGAAGAGLLNHGVNKYGSGLLATGGSRLANTLDRTTSRIAGGAERIVPKVQLAARLAASDKGKIKKKDKDK